MGEVKVSDASSLCGNVSNGKSHIQQFVLQNQDQRWSSSSVESTPEIEKKYVCSVYDAIAPHFNSTCSAKWPKFANFLQSLSLGSLILDARCGNGKYLGLNPDCFSIGCDNSAPLVNICTDGGHEALVADAVNLPYGFGDVAISIAVLHHLSTENRRKKAIHELVCVVKKCGLVLIAVWAVEQEDGLLVAKWTSLTEKYVEEWFGPSIPETEEKGSGEHLKDSKQFSPKKLQETVHMTSNTEDDSVASKNEKHIKNQKEYFVLKSVVLLLLLLQMAWQRKMIKRVH